MATNLAFDSNSLQTANIIIEDIQIDDVPEIDLKAFNFTRQDGGKITGKWYNPKLVRAIGKVVGSSQSDVESRLDTLRLNTSGQDKNLDVDYIAGTRRFGNSTLKSMKITRPVYGAAWAAFTAEFISTDGFSQDTAAATLVNNVNWTFTSLFTVSKSESVAVSEAIALAVSAPTLFVAVAESVTVSESKGVTTVFNVSKSESVTVSEAKSVAVI